MKERKNSKHLLTARLLAMLLTMVMLFSSSGIQALAEETVDEWEKLTTETVFAQTEEATEDVSEVDQMEENITETVPEQVAETEDVTESETVAETERVTEETTEIAYEVSTEETVVTEEVTETLTETETENVSEEEEIVSVEETMTEADVNLAAENNNGGTYESGTTVEFFFRLDWNTNAVNPDTDSTLNHYMESYTSHFRMQSTLTQQVTLAKDQVISDAAAWINTYTTGVSDNGDGTLKVDSTISIGTHAVNEMSFINTFEGSVKLTKKDVNGKTLGGAQFQLYAKQEDGSYQVYVSDESANGLYTTDANGELTVSKLPAGDYYFVETKAPKGYVISKDAEGQPVKYLFTIAMEAGKAQAELTVVNESGTEGSISVTKRTTLFEGGDMVDITMKDATFYVGLFKDAEGKQPCGTNYVKSIHMSGQNVSEVVTFSGLESGVYYILETDASGNAFAMNAQQNDDIVKYQCMVDGEGSNMVTLDLAADVVEGKVNLNNLYLDLPAGYYRDAEISITKTVMKDGKETRVSDDFYVGIFTKESDGTLALYDIVELAQNGMVAVTVPLGGADGTEDITYYVYETDALGNLIDKDTFVYEVSGEGAVTVTAEEVEASITLINTVKDEEEETEEETEKVVEKTSQEESSEAVDTGDQTPISLYTLLLVVSAAVFVLMIFKRKIAR